MTESVDTRVRTTPVDLTEFMPQNTVPNHDPRRWASPAIPRVVAMEPSITPEDVRRAAFEAAERPMGAYVADRAAEVAARRDLQTQHNGSMVVAAVNNHFNHRMGWQ